MLTREQIEEIQAESREKGYPCQAPAERERYSCSPILLVEAEIQQSGSSGGLSPGIRRSSAGGNADAQYRTVIKR